MKTCNCRSGGLRLYLCLSALAAAFVVSPPPARAQGQDWQFGLTVYGWLAGMSGTIKTGRASGSDFDVSFSDILDSLDTFPVMLSGEARYGRFGIVTDFIYLATKADIDTRGVLFNGGEVKLTSLEWSVAGYYRLFDEKTFKLDGGAGFRLWDLSTEITLNPGLLPGASEKVDETFVDPILALRANIALSDTWSVSLLGDIGGFGVSSDFTWQALGTINYRAANWVDLRLGYRYLALERDAIDVDLYGPIAGATFRF